MIISKAQLGYNQYLIINYRFISNNIVIRCKCKRVYEYVWLFSFYFCQVLLMSPLGKGRKASRQPTLDVFCILYIIFECLLSFIVVCSFLC